MKWLGHNELKRLLALLSVLLLLFCLFFAGSYINESLQNAYKAAAQRTASTAEMLESKLKSIRLASNIVYANQNVFDWISASNITATMDVQMVRSTGDCLRTNDTLVDIVLYNATLKRLFATTLYAYRDISLYPEEDVKNMIFEGDSAYLQFKLITYDGKESLALVLPHNPQARPDVGRVVLIYEIDKVASSVSSLLAQNSVDGSRTFVVTHSDPHNVIMGTAPDGFQASEELPDQSLWLSFLRTGQLVTRSSISLQGWDVYSVLYVDTFISTHMPFVKIIILITAVLFCILLVSLLRYIQQLRAPYTRLATMLRRNLPPDSLTHAVNSPSESAILSDLQTGIQYLLNRIVAVDRTDTDGAYNSNLLAWATALGTDRKAALDRSVFFPAAHIQMGVARIEGYDARSLDYFARQTMRQKTGDFLRNELARRWQPSYCVGMGDGCFVLLINGDSLDEDRLETVLTELARVMEYSLKITVHFGISPVLPREEEGLSEMYRQLYGASYLCFINNTRLVCTTGEYQEYLSQTQLVDDNCAIQQIVRLIRDGDDAAVSQSISKYMAMLANMPIENVRASISTLLYTLQTQFSKVFSTEDYQSMQNFLPSCRSLTDVEARLQSICLSLIHASAKSTETTPQWHEIILDITDHVLNSLSDPQLSVEQIADKEGYSPNYIRSMFKTYMGDSLSNYIRKKRMETACRMLLNSDESIVEIMSQCGFSNRSSFFSAFKNTYGVTPTQYRTGQGKEADRCMGQSCPR